MRWTGPFIAMFLLIACPIPDDDDSAPIDDDDACPDAYTAQSCDETFCGPPTLSLGTGAVGYEPLPEDGTIPIWYGGGMGDCMYHLRLAARTEELCSTVFIDYTVTIEQGDELMWEASHHVMMVRPDLDASLQYFYGMEAFVPVEWHPDDPEHADMCPPESGSTGSLTDVQVRLEMEVHDHDDRAATAEATLQPVCCGPLR